GWSSGPGAAPRSGSSSTPTRCCGGSAIDADKPTAPVDGAAGNRSDRSVGRVSIIPRRRGLTQQTGGGRHMLPAKIVNQTDERVVVQVPRWFMEQERLASRELEGVILARTSRALLFRGRAAVRESRYCLRCGQEITNPA